MANGTVGISEPASPNKLLDAESLTVAAQTVFRERVQVTGAADVEISRVLNSTPAGTEYALVTRNIPSGTQTISGTVTDNQGTPAALANAWPIKLTDGTNTMPTMDVAARAGFVELTDGTNTASVKAASTAAVATDKALVVTLSPNTPLPAGSNALGSVTVTGTTAISGTVTANQGTANTLANKWPVQVTDGTNTLPTMDVAARAGFQKVTDGTNTMPTMDTAARAGFVQITDATNTASVKAASTAAVAADKAVVVAISPNSNTADIRRGQTLLFAKIDFAASGDNTVVAAAGVGLKNKVVSYVIVADAAVAAKWFSGAAGTALSGAMSLAANGGVSAVGTPGSWLLETATNTALVLNLSGAVGVRGHISYIQEA